MRRRLLLGLSAGGLLAWGGGRAAAAARERSEPVLVPLRVEELVARNAAARGGVEAWRRIDSMAWTGRAESGATPGAGMPFLMEQQRPNRVRFELIQNGLRSVRAFDGEAGWKLRPDPATGRADVQPFTPQELAFARASQVIEGPLMDGAARAAAITLAGEGEVDGHPAYVLELRLPSGALQRVWLDPATALELRHDRSVRGASGAGSMVSVLFRDYRDFEGLKLPTVIETTAEPGRPASRLVIERVALNPPLDDSAFVRPPEPRARHRGVVVDTRSAARPPGGDAAPP